MEISDRPRVITVLVAEAEAAATAAGCASMYLYTVPTDPGVDKFYAACG